MLFSGYLNCKKPAVAIQRCSALDVMWSNSDNEAG